MKFNKRTTMNMSYTACGGCGTRIDCCHKCKERFKDEEEEDIVYCDSEENAPNQGATHLCAKCVVLKEKTNV